jgi:hypothetical protein
MSAEIERKLSEQDKAIAAELGRNIGATARDVPTRMPGAATHTPVNNEKPDGQAERYRSLSQDREPQSRGTLADRMDQQREKQAARPEQSRTQEQGRER